MNKFFVIVFILGFWLILPIPIAYLSYGQYDNNQMKAIQSDISSLSESANTERECLPTLPYLDYMYCKASNLFSDIGKTGKTIGTILLIYFKVLVIGIPNVHEYINYFLWFLKIISVTAIFLLYKGN